MKAYGCKWSKMTVYKSIWSYMNVNGSKKKCIWKCMKLGGGIGI